MEVEKCVKCGEDIPEGRLICTNCEDETLERVRFETAKEILEEVYGYMYEHEVALRYLLRELGSKYGVDLKKQTRRGFNGYQKK